MFMITRFIHDKITNYGKLMTANICIFFVVAGLLTVTPALSFSSYFVTVSGAIMTFLVFDKYIGDFLLSDDEKQDKFFKAIVIQLKLLFITLLSFLILKFNNENLILLCAFIFQNLFLLSVKQKNIVFRSTFGTAVFAIATVALFLDILR